MMLRLGIAGIGIAAEQVLPHIGAIADTVSLTAVADVRPEALRAFGPRYPGVQLFDSVEALCASDAVDVVWVSTPNEFHAQHAVLAAKHGKHVVCEKPMATSVAECNEIVAAIESNRVKYVQGHSKIYYSAIRRMREAIKSGELGRVTQINTWNFQRLAHPAARRLGREHRAWNRPRFSPRPAPGRHRALSRRESGRERARGHRPA